MTGVSDDRLYQAIKARIIAYEFPQGKRIYLEPIANDLGVSTWRVRQLFDRLAVEGLVIKAPHKGFYALTMHQDDMTGHHHITRHLLSLGLEKLNAAADRELHCHGSITEILTGLNRCAPDDGDSLATYTAAIFTHIAALTKTSTIIDAIDRSNDQLHYLRMLECRGPNHVKSDLTCFCELLLADDWRELVSALEDYHERRVSSLPGLLKCARR